MEKTVVKFTDIIGDYYFEMFSDEGNNACRQLMYKIHKRISGKERIDKEQLFQFIRDEVKKVSVKHGEIYDSEPQYHIAHLTRMICEENFYNSNFGRFDIF